MNVVNLQMLGTGDAFSKSYYNNNGLLLGQGYTLLIDCGTTAPAAMRQMGKSFHEIDAVLITHIHDDHVGGLASLAGSMKDHGRKMRLLLSETLVDPLWQHLLQKGLAAKARAERLADMFEIKPLQADRYCELSEDITFKLIRTPHIQGRDSYSLLLNEDVFYSADMTFQPELLLKLVRKEGVRKILHDCQLTGPGHVHTTLKELMSLPEDVRRLILLMHYSDRKPDFEGRTGEMDFLEQHKIYSL
ncbi:MBL fold metallo-hydrolase [Paenibacillus sp. PK3_47]|uniref:MBL fold metallo-hydrolase n=1 Tax=Paenibacillus sp. PK3_47 TaxID=2072642 RepID=UPI00201DBF20|nr:MBL fold metallo-hydrolase [Paenibacillus sp. PK3_47]UQZ36280.1 MBL fold metallo-hydrolase [Paenibacillus sp. PK3_47]